MYINKYIQLFMKCQAEANHSISVNSYTTTIIRITLINFSQYAS